MAKLTLTDITAGYDTATISAANNLLIETALENTLSRDGTSPNQMEANLDMNSYRVQNIPDAVANQEPVTLAQAASIAGVTNALTQESVAAVLYPQTAAETSAGVTPTDYSYEPGNVLRYGTNTTPGTTDMTTAIQAAIDVSDDVVIPKGTMLVGTTLSARDGVKVRCFADLTVTAFNFIQITTISRFEWRGGTITGDYSTNGQSCFVLETGTTDCYLAPTKITDFKNKGVDINTASHRNIINGVECTKADGTTGSCFSVFGAGADICADNKFIDVYAHNARAGVSVQGSTGTKVIRPVVDTMTLWGVGLDGVVTAAGDGPTGTEVLSATIKNVSSSSYGGIYLGNGSSHSIISHPIIRDCYTGIRTSGGTGYEVEHNVIIAPNIDGDTDTLAAGVDGINLSSADYTQVVNPIIHNVTTYGLRFFSSDYGLVNGGEIYNCGDAGVYTQSASLECQGVYSHDNAYGFRSEFGGSQDSLGRCIDCRADTNSTADFKTTGGLQIQNSGGLTYELVSTTNVITNIESGKTFYLNAAGGFTSTLPAPAAGLKYKFIVRIAPTTDYVITTDSGDNIMTGTFLDIVGELEAITAQDTLTFVANTALVGDWLEVESDGTNWYCTARSRADGGITVSVT